jgi:hypothetical protein
MRDFDYVPFMVTASSRPSLTETVDSEPNAKPLNPQLTPQNALTLSSFCDPSFTRLVATQQHIADQASIRFYDQPNRWTNLMLARLVPLVGYIESAATAYNLSPDFLLRILVNESDLNPLAVGPTDDLGLSQVTSDALTLLKGVSSDVKNDFYNPRLFPETFSVFDPDFSICAGAAKLAWAQRQPGVDNELEAYAVYINPIYGLENGTMSEVYLLKTEPLSNLRTMSGRLAAVFALYETEPERLSDLERQLVSIAYSVRDRKISLEAAYTKVFDLTVQNNLNDSEMYQRLLSSYFGVVDTQTLAEANE